MQLLASSDTYASGLFRCIFYWWRYNCGIIVFKWTCLDWPCRHGFLFRNSAYTMVEMLVSRISTHGLIPKEVTFYISNFVNPDLLCWLDDMGLLFSASHYDEVIILGWYNSECDLSILFIYWSILKGWAAIIGLLTATQISQTFCLVGSVLLFANTNLCLVVSLLTMSLLSSSLIHLLAWEEDPKQYIILQKISHKVIAWFIFKLLCWILEYSSESLLSVPIIQIWCAYHVKFHGDSFTAYQKRRLFFILTPGLAAICVEIGN